MPDRVLFRDSKSSAEKSRLIIIACLFFLLAALYFFSAFFFCGFASPRHSGTFLRRLFAIQGPVSAIPAAPPWSRSNMAQQSDLFRISLNSYDTVFLSMYPIEPYDEADFLYFRGMNILKTDRLLPDLSSLRKYMERIAESGNPVSTVYLGIRPDKITAGELLLLTAAYPEMVFEVIIAHPSIEYWRQLSNTQYEKTLAAYCDFLSAVGDSPNMRFYFFASEEWLTCNSGLYTDNWSLTPDAARYVMTTSDICHSYQVTPDNAARLSAALRRLTAVQRTTPTTYPDLKDTAIVFFGDSIIGNYTDGMSIPGSVHGLTGASVYNLGYNGNSAAMHKKAVITLPGIADAFVKQDSSVIPKDAQVYAGFLEYAANPPRTDCELIFVINYGLNDYFLQNPISSEDPYDITTYSGAIRTAVSCLKKHYKDARIFLCTPTYTPLSDEENSLSLEDYVNAVIDLSCEMNVDVIDNYSSLGIDETNHHIWLTDKVHLNEKGRFEAARIIINAICK